MEIERRLMNIKQTISTANSQYDQLKGRRNELIEQLSEKHDCDSTDEAIVTLKKAKKLLSKLENSLETDLEKIENKL